MSRGPAAGVRLRKANAEDLEAMRQIYAYHVLHGTASFEVAPPDPEDFACRFRSVREDGLPWLVAEAGGRVLGYAYAAPYRPRAAYRFTVEDSVYVEPAAQGQGLGGSLLAAVIEGASAAGKRQMVAVIADCAANPGSLALHEKLGFRQVGIFSHVGFKFGRWLDTLLMQRTLGEGAVKPSHDAPA